MATRPELHSAEFLSASRRFWWNPDFLQLMAIRWQLDEVRTALDVGCGVGHWTMTLATLLDPEATVVGVDREPTWVAIANDVAAHTGVAGPMRFEVGAAEALPFSDDSFDLVTCQTVLIHLPDPVRALAEMRRVLKPGGLLAVIEPNNRIQPLVFNEAQVDEPVADTLARVRFRLLCELGKKRMGLGDFSAGDRLPTWLYELGFREIQVCQSDKAVPLVPPYASVEEQAVLGELLEAGEAGDGGRERARRWFLAGGGEPAEFEALWALLRDVDARERALIQAGRFARAGGRLMYLVSARK
jgi:ubiquinone/menaquinone biosynthesis C-methylase UbiE